MDLPMQSAALVAENLERVVQLTSNAGFAQNLQCFFLWIVY